MRARPQSKRLLQVAAWAMAICLIRPDAAKAVFDLTGDWLITVPYVETFQSHITQNGTTIIIDDNKPGVIDPETGEFEIQIMRNGTCPGPLTMYGETIDADHIETHISGYIPYFPGFPCQLVGLFTTGVRIGAPTSTRPPTSTPTQTPIRSATRTPTHTSTPRPRFCAGDCNHDERVTVAEAQSLIRCTRRDLYGPSRCNRSCADMNRNGLIDMNEMNAAVDNLAHGCP